MCAFVDGLFSVSLCLNWSLGRSEARGRGSLIKVREESFELDHDLVAKARWLIP